MKKYFYSLSFYAVALILIGGVSPLSAQTEDVKPVTSSKEAIKILKNGVLIVRLPSHEKKIAAMEKLINDPTVSSANKKNLKKQVALTQQETQLRNSAIVQGFQSSYSFSDVLFIYDYQTTALKEGNTKGIFLNEQLKVDESIQLNNRSYLFARFGKTDVNTTTGVEGIVITDDNLVDLTKPFPAYVREGGIRYLMDKAFDKQNADKRNMPRLVEKLNKNLERYAQSIGG